MADNLVYFILLLLCQPPGIHVGQCRVGTSNYTYHDPQKCEERSKQDAIKASAQGWVVINAECRPLILTGRAV